MSESKLEQLADKVIDEWLDELTVKLLKDVEGIKIDFANADYPTRLRAKSILEQALIRRLRK